MRLLVVIVNYRSAELTIDCLRALASEVPQIAETQVVVTDNDSGDGEAARIASAIESEGWSSWARCRALPRNGGFAYGNNAAIEPALRSDDPPEYVLLLNPDTVPRPGALQALLAFLDAHPAVGIAGSRLEYEDGTQHHSRFRFHTIRSEIVDGLRLGFVTKLLQRHMTAPPLVLHDHPIDWVAGASMMVRKTVFDAIGLFDEGYFLYYEETDFCLRAARAGWPCWYVPESRVVHLVGKSSGLTDLRVRAARRPRYWFESRQRYFVKNHGRLYAFFANLSWALCYSLWRVRRRLQRKPDEDPPHLLADFVRFHFLRRTGDPTASPVRLSSSP
ncbi:MAG: glycosyltransferase family 2 protein [Planctomycetes bacterium]|nr:glycosyltransferase family 2 protein [Planctomycetota bacterium]